MRERLSADYDSEIVECLVRTAADRQPRCLTGQENHRIR